MDAIMKALGSVTGAFSLVGFLGAVSAWAYVATATARLRTARESIAQMPERDRIRALETIYGPIPKSVTSDKWIAEKRNRLFLIAFLGVLVAAVAIVALVTQTTRP